MNSPNPNNPWRNCIRCGVAHQRKHKWCRACFVAYEKENYWKKKDAKLHKIELEKQLKEAFREEKAQEQDATYELELMVPDNRLKKLVPYIPNPGGKKFHESEAPFRAMIGGKGSGKSTTALVEVYMTALAYPGTDILIGQEIEDHLRGGTWKSLKKIIPPELIASELKRPLTIRLKNGSTIYGSNLADINRLGSTCFGAIFIEEAHHIRDEDIYQELIARLRSEIGPNRLWLCAYNVGRNWIWRRFIHEPNEDCWGVIIQTYENKEHLHKDFIPRLERSYSEKERAQFLLGELVDDTGEIFWMFSEDRHVIDPMGDERFREGIPLHWKRYLGIDPGIGDNAAVVEVVVDEEHNHYVVNLIQSKNLTISQLMQKVKEKVDLEGLTWASIDPSVATNRNDETANTKIDIFRENGLKYIRSSSRDKELHISLIKELLQPLEGPPKLYIFSNCGPLIHEMKYWRRDSSGKPRDGNEDCISALRFIVATKPYAPESLNKKPEKNSFWKRFEEIIQEIDSPPSPIDEISSRDIAWI